MIGFILILALICIGGSIGLAFAATTTAISFAVWLVVTILGLIFSIIFFFIKTTFKLFGWLLILGLIVSCGIMFI